MFCFLCFRMLPLSSSEDCFGIATFVLSASLHARKEKCGKCYAPTSQIARHHRSASNLFLRSNAMEPDATDEPDNSLRRRHAASAESQPPRSPSPGNTTSSGISTWQDQLREARLGIARKVQEQQQQDQLPGAELDGDQHEEVEPANTSARRESVTTEDGQDDAEVAEMLRPSRPATPSVQQFASTEKLERNDESDSAQQTQAGTAEHGTDTSGADKICRICFDSEDEELGKLFSPCRCRGTVRRALFIQRSQESWLNWPFSFS